MKYSFSFIAIGILIFSWGCETGPESGDPQEEVVDDFQELKNQGLVIGDLNPFPLIENPAYIPVHEINYIQENELVFITRACGYVQVFPHRSMHVEVVNEMSHGTLMAVTYCPRTRSGINWNRVYGQDTLLLTASGYRFKENLMALDLNSGSIWSQMLLLGMSGKHKMEEISTLAMLETTWLTVQEFFPAAGVYVNSSFFKSAADRPTGLEMGIVSRESVELFTLDMFPGELALLHTHVNPGGKVVVAGSALYHYMVAFQSSYEMQPLPGEFPVIMIDDTGTRWNIFGEAVSGARGGEQLQSPVFYSAADWAWRDLYEDVSYFKPTP